MGLVEFLRQWQGGRLAGGIVLSVLLHLLLVAAVLWGPSPLPTASVKRGEPLIVELPEAADSPPPGRPGRAPAPPPRPRAPRPAVAARPTPPPPKPPEPVREPRTVSTPVAKAPERPAPPSPALPEPAAVAARPPEPTPVEAPAAPRPAPTPAATQPPAPEAVPVPASAPPQVASLPPAPPERPLPDLRSLGRGSGGAGGSGRGRAGIEGEPIPLDSTDPRYSDYLDQVRRRIKDKWGFPCVKNAETHTCEYKTVQLIIEFGIAKNGSVPFVNVVKTSGYPIYDDYAVNAVKLADFPPIPDAFSKTGVPILATFSYVVQSSLTNILR